MKNKYINLKAVVLCTMIFLVSSAMIPAMGFEPNDDFTDPVDPVDPVDPKDDDSTSKTNQLLMDSIMNFKNSAMYSSTNSDKTMIYGIPNQEGGIDCYTTGSSDTGSQVQNLDTYFEDSDYSIAGSDREFDGEIPRLDCSFNFADEAAPYFEFSPMVENHDVTRSGSFKLIIENQGHINYQLSCDEPWVKSIEPAYGVLSTTPIAGGVGIITENEHQVEIDASKLGPGSHVAPINVDYTISSSSVAGSFQKQIPTKLTIWADPDQGPSPRYRIVGTDSLHDNCVEGYIHGSHSVIVDIWNAGQPYTEETSEGCFEFFAEDADSDLYYLNQDSGDKRVYDDYGRVIAKKLQFNIGDTVSSEVRSDGFQHYMVKTQVQTYGDHGEGRFKHTPVEIKTPNGISYNINVGSIHTNDDDELPLTLSGFFPNSGSFCFELVNAKFSNPYMKSLNDNSVKTKHSLLGGGVKLDLGTVTMSKDYSTYSFDKPGIGSLVYFSATGYDNPDTEGPNPVTYTIYPFTGDGPFESLVDSQEDVMNWNGCPVSPIVPVTLPKGDLGMYGSMFGESDVERGNRDLISFKVRDMIGGRPSNLKPGHYEVPMNHLLEFEGAGYNFLFFMIGAITLEFDLVVEKDVNDPVIMSQTPDVWSTGPTTGLMDYQVFEMDQPIFSDTSTASSFQSVRYTPLSSSQFCNHGLPYASESVFHDLQYPEYDIYPKDVAEWHSVGDPSNFHCADYEKSEEESGGLYSSDEIMVGVSYPYNPPHIDDNDDEDDNVLSPEIDETMPENFWGIKNLTDVSEIMASLGLAPWPTQNQIGQAFIEVENAQSSVIKLLLQSDDDPVDDNDDEDPIPDDEDDTNPDDPVDDDPVDDNDEEDSDDSEDNESDNQQTLLEKVMDFIRTILGKLGLQI